MVKRLETFTLTEAMDRREPKWTQEELERESGVSQSSISAIRRGANRNPQTRIVQKLEDALGLERGQLRIEADPQAQSRLPLRKKAS